jgi:hypothetical protein
MLPMSAIKSGKSAECSGNRQDSETSGQLSRHSNSATNPIASGREISLAIVSLFLPSGRTAYDIVFRTRVELAPREQPTLAGSFA